MIVKYHCPKENCSQRQHVHVDGSLDPADYSGFQPFCEVHFRVMELEVVT